MGLLPSDLRDSLTLGFPAAPEIPSVMNRSKPSAPPEIRKKDPTYLINSWMSDVAARAGAANGGPSEVMGARILNWGCDNGSGAHLFPFLPSDLVIGGSRLLPRGPEEPGSHL